MLTANPPCNIFSSYCSVSRLYSLHESVNSALDSVKHPPPPLYRNLKSALGRIHLYDQPVTSRYTYSIFRSCSTYFVLMGDQVLLEVHYWLLKQRNIAKSILDIDMKCVRMSYH